jgi:hypothetical protein
MRLLGAMKTLPREADCNDEGWPIFEPMLDSDGVHAPLTQAFSARTSAAIDTLAEATYARLRYALIVGEFTPGESFTLGAANLSLSGHWLGSLEPALRRCAMRCRDLLRPTRCIKIVNQEWSSRY